MFYSRLFSLDQNKRKTQKTQEKNETGNKDFLLHREFGHFRLPKLQEQPLAKQYIKHLLAGLSGLIK
jgi:cytochrome c oxidase assembly factor CtaG